MAPYSMPFRTQLYINSSFTLNLKTAVIKHTKDELILQTAYSDLEDFYDTIVLPPPPRKPKGKPTVENHVKYLETHLIEKLKENIYTSLEELNAAIKKSSSPQFQVVSEKALLQKGCL